MRIERGTMKVEYLAELGDKLPKGRSRDAVGDKSVRVLMKLYEFEDGFMELYPGECLFGDKRCKEPNKGCFPCWSCSSYLNAFYGVNQEKFI